MPGAWRVVCLTMLLGITFGVFAQDKVPPSPPGLIFWSLQHLEKDQPYPPMPFNPFAGTTVYLLDDKNATYDDRVVDYVQLREEAAFEAALKAVLEPEAPQPLAYGPGDLWLEITDIGPSTVSLRLHNTDTSPGTWYQILMKNDLNLTNWFDWQIGPVAASGNPQGYTDFPPLETRHEEKLFFTAVAANSMVRISRVGADDANEGGGTPGRMVITNMTAVAEPLEVRYLPAGTAVNGTASTGADYWDHNTWAPLSGAVLLGTNATETIEIYAVNDYTPEHDESVTLRLLPWPGYVVDPTNSMATILIYDATPTNPYALFTSVTTNAVNCLGIDYNPVNSSLIVSVNKDAGQSTNNFARVFADNGATVVTPWSTISGLLEEIKLATVKTNLGGFVTGDVFFGNGVAGQVARSSASGLPAGIANPWVQLSGETNHLRGSLYVDQSGVWDYDLIVVTGNEATEHVGDKRVWRVDASANATKVATINTWHLEGVVTIPDDPQRWGPWAGRVLTGNERDGQIFAINTGGGVDVYEFGLDPEDFDLIPTGANGDCSQDLYCTAYRNNSIMKLPKAYLIGHGGDLLITQAGEHLVGSQELFVVRWNNQTKVFDLWGTRFIDSLLEHVTFAPINLPAN